MIVNKEFNYILIIEYSNKGPYMYTSRALVSQNEISQFGDICVNKINHFNVVGTSS